MAGSKVSEYSIGDVNLSALMTSTDAQRLGYHAVSLTEYETTTIPEIAAGSKIEVNGALYKFDSDETITGSPSDGDVYIKLIPSGTSITAEFTSDAPTWDDEKQGWYESATNNRYLDFKMTKSGSDYTDKYPMQHARENVYGYLEDGTPTYAKFLTGTIDNGQTEEQINHGIASAYTNQRIMSITASIDDAGGTTLYQPSFDVSSIVPKWTGYNDTQIRVARGGSAGTYSVYVFVIYK